MQFYLLNKTTGLVFWGSFKNIRFQSNSFSLYFTKNTGPHNRREMKIKNWMLTPAAHILKKIKIKINKLIKNWSLTTGSTNHCPRRTLSVPPPHSCLVWQQPFFLFERKMKELLN